MTVSQPARRVLAFGLLLLGSALACQGDSTGPGDDYELPDPDLRLDPNLIVLGDTMVACGVWKVTPPPAGIRLLVDVHFGGGVFEAGAHDAHADGVETVGGKVLIGFPFPALRVRINAERVDDLLANWPRATVLTVPNAARYDWPAIRIQYSRQFTTTDSTLIVSSGGRVRSVALVDNVQAHAIVDLPTISVTPLRLAPGVLWVAPNASGAASCQ